MSVDWFCSFFSSLSSSCLFDCEQWTLNVNIHGLGHEQTREKKIQREKSDLLWPFEQNNFYCVLWSHIRTKTGTCSKAAFRADFSIFFHKRQYICHEEKNIMQHIFSSQSPINWKIRLLKINDSFSQFFVSVLSWWIFVSRKTSNFSSTGVLKLNDERTSKKSKLVIYW